MSRYSLIYEIGECDIYDTIKKLKKCSIHTAGIIEIRRGWREEFFSFLAINVVYILQEL